MPLKCSRFAAVVGMVTLSASSAFAGVGSWPSVRHDARRTGLSEGVGKLTIPAVRGRSFLGGSLSTPRLLVEDVNSDGTNEVLLANGGRVLAKDAQNRVLWDTALLEVQSLHGVYDFNGDGVEEVLALGRDGLHILNLRNGSLLWHKTDYSTSNNITSATNTSVVDLTGDGLPEIIVKPFWFSDGFVYVYSFSEGFDLEEPNSNQLWAYELRQDFIGGFYPTVGDVDLDGVPEIVSSTDDHLVVIDGLTGAEDASFELEHTLYFGRTEIRNIDQDPQPEIIHITNQYGHSLEVFDLLKSREEPMSEVAWASTDSLTIPRNALQDLDGDGTFEFFLNQFDGSQWHTLIYQYESTALTGDEELVLSTELANTMAVDALDLDGDGRYELLTRSADSGTLALSTFSTLKAYDVIDGTLSERWRLENAAWQLINERTAPNLNAVATGGAVASQDVDGDGALELFVTQDTNGDGRPNRLVLIESQGSDLTEVAATELAADERPDVLWLADPGGTDENAYAALAYDASGYLWFLDTALNRAESIKIGGHYEVDALVADLDDDQVNELLLTTSGGFLKALDPSGLEQAGDVASTLWSVEVSASQYGPVIDVDGDGILELVSRNDSEAVPSLDLLDPSGQVIARAEFDALPAGLVAGPLLGSGAMDLFGNYKRADGRYYLFVLDGQSWTIAWETEAPFESPPPSSVSSVLIDLNGDGLQDIAFGQGRYLCGLSGLTGASLGCVDQNIYDGGLIAGSLDNDRQEELALIANDRVRLIDSNNTTVWEVLESETGETWGSSALDPGGVIADYDGDGIVELYFAALDTVVCMTGQGQFVWTSGLAKGRVVASGSGERLSHLAAADINGNGSLEIIVGSRDGYLYALDGATGALEWSHPFFYQVGDPIVADVDQDGLVDVAVPIADGYLYLLTQATLSPVPEVREVAVSADGTLQDETQDVDQTEQAGLLGIAWDASDGAVGYLYAVLSDNNSYVIDWTDVGPTTSVIVSDQRLTYGHTYRALVQAYDAERGGSPWQMSDGVEIVDISPPTVTSVVASPDPFDPEETSTTIIALLQDPTELARYRVEILDGEELVFQAEERMGGSIAELQVPWDGRDDAGERVLDGTYTVRVTAVDVGDRQGQAEGTVTVRTSPPLLMDLLIMPNPFDPNQTSCEISAAVVEVSGLSYGFLEVFKEGESIAYQGIDVSNQPDELVTNWDGLTSSGSIQEGAYTAVVGAQDIHGNLAQLAGSLWIDTSAPVIRYFDAEPSTFDPGDGAVRLRAKLEDTVSLAGYSLEVLDDTQVLFTTSAEVDGNSLILEHAWDGRDQSGQAMNDGVYRVQLSAYDGADHTTTKSLEVTLERTVQSPPTDINITLWSGSGCNCDPSGAAGDPPRQDPIGALFPFGLCGVLLWRRRR